MTVVTRLARFVVERSWDDLSEVAPRELKIRVRDAFGCALGALEATSGGLMTRGAGC
jgi:2-methylcitrate dehydratase